jgi:cytochrome c peroxidase
MRRVLGIVLSLALLAPVLHAQGYELPKGLADQEMAPVPADNPLTVGKIKLGEQLFFDKRLSKTKQMSCETCHVPEKGWTDNLALSPKFDGSVNVRHSPTLYGVAFYPDLYWDGRAKGLEVQILAAWKGQMSAARTPSPRASGSAYQPLSNANWAACQRSQREGPLLHSHHHAENRMIGWQDQEKSAAGAVHVPRRSRSAHLACRPSIRTAVTSGGAEGRGPTSAAADPVERRLGHQPAPPEAQTLQGAFKTPSLRGVGLTWPYFHDGHAKTLEEAVDAMLKGGVPNPQLDEKLKPANLTPKQRADLLAFLKAITPDVKPYPRPTLP